VEDHLSTTGVIQNCEDGIPRFDDAGEIDFVSTFKNFGILKLQQVLDEQDALKDSLPEA